MSWAQQFQGVMVNRCIQCWTIIAKTTRNKNIVCSVWGQPWPSRRGRPPRISPGVKTSQHIIRHHLPFHLNPVFRTPQCQRAQHAPPLPQPSSGSITKGLPKVLKEDKTDNQVGRCSLHLEVRQSFEREEGWGQDPVQGRAWRHLQGQYKVQYKYKYKYKYKIQYKYKYKIQYKDVPGDIFKVSSRRYWDSSVIWFSRNESIFLFRVRVWGMSWLSVSSPTRASIVRWGTTRETRRLCSFMFSLHSIPSYFLTLYLDWYL